jgi:hypothetical protein
MPEIRCKKCGGMTNTALSDHINNESGMADECYAKWDEVEMVWVRGCTKSKEEFIESFVRKLINGN